MKARSVEPVVERIKKSMTFSHMKSKIPNLKDEEKEFGEDLVLQLKNLLIEHPSGKFSQMKADLIVTNYKLVVTPPSDGGKDFPEGLYSFFFIPLSCIHK